MPSSVLAEEKNPLTVKSRVYTGSKMIDLLQMTDGT